MTLYKWSQTAATNGTADSTCPAPEGMAPSTINDSMRGMMAAVAKHRDDISGQIATTGTSTAYLVSSFQGFDTLTNMHGKEVWFTPHTTNLATVTLNVDSLGGKPLRSAPGVELPAGVMIQGTPIGAIYNNTDGAWYLKGLFGNPFNIPLGGGLDYWGLTVPNSSFAFPIGQAVSRTGATAPLFALFGTTYGVGDGSTTFNLPDKTGRASVMKEAAGTRLTTAGSGVDGGTLGSAGGGQSKTLITANLPPYTPSGAVATTINDGGNVVFNTAGGNLAPPTGATGITHLTATSTFTGNAQGGTSTPFATVQPTIVCNYIIRIL